MPQRAPGSKGGRAPRARLDFAASRRQFPRAAPAPRAVRRKDRMRTYLSFETAVADIEARLDEMRAVAEKGDSPALAEEIAQARGQGREGAGRSLRQPDALAEDAGRARAGASAFRRLRQGAHHRVHAPRRRPLFRRGRSHRRRPGKIRGRVGLRHRPGEGRRHGEPGAGTISAWRARKAIARRRA